MDADYSLHFPLHLSSINSSLESIPFDSNLSQAEACFTVNVLGKENQWSYIQF